MKKTTLFAPLALTLALGLMTGCTARMQALGQLNV